MHCDHCSSPLTQPLKSTIGDVPKTFCCTGCKHVAQLIYSESLDDFYTIKKGVITLNFKHQYPLEYYDCEDFKTEYIKHNTLELISSNIHCAACVFLIEKILLALPEVIYARVNLTQCRIRIELSGEGKISHIFKSLAAIGYSAHTIDTNALEIQAKKQQNLMLKRIAFAFFAMMNMLWISISLYTGADSGEFYDYFMTLSFLLATPTLLYSGWGFLSASIKAIKHYSLTMDVPIAIGSVTTYLYSLAVMLDLVVGQIYFDTVVNFIFIILLGRYLETSSKYKIITDHNSLKNLDPKVITRLDGTDEEIIPTKLIKVGELFRVKAGEVIGVDGTISEGFISVDESLLSGESLPVEKTISQQVYAGTLVTNGSAVIKVRHIYSESSYAKIKQLVNDAQITKGRISSIIDKIIPYFIISTITVALLSFGYHISTGAVFDFALMAGVSVLIITCPCAFGIAVPMTYYAAHNVLYKNKIIIKDSNILENLHKLDTIVFDKTGTLTTGVFTVTDVKCTTDKHYCLQIAKSLALYSKHPLSQSIALFINQEPLPAIHFADYPGYGMSASIKNTQYYMGSATFIQQHTNLTIPPTDSHHSLVYVTDAYNLLAIFTLIDEINAYADELIRYLHRKQKRIVILSGDRGGRVADVASALGIQEYYAEQTPASKLAFIQSESNVLMIGDGLNDTPALKAANYSIAIRGLELVESAVSAIVMKNNLAAIRSLYQVAHRARSTIKCNISFALGYNIVFVPLAFLGILNPVIAAIVMPISSLVVISNAIRLQLK